MFKEIVEVSRIEGERIQVRFLRSKMCSCCSFSSICHTQDGTIWIDKPEFTLKEGDKVEVGIEERANIIANFLVFLLPSTVFLGILVLLRDRSPLFSFYVALMFVGIYYIFLKVIMQIRKRNFQLRILRKV